MKKYLESLPIEIKNLVCLARDISVKDNMPAYLVGGVVRDLILGIKNLDLDIVVEGDGIKFARKFSGSLNARIVEHARFGTATVTLPDNIKVDFSTARKEIYPEPACLPQVSGGSLQDDLSRRDFSINAMAISIGAKDFARAIDHFCGKSDLRMKKIRILHDASFIDDPTRILRAVRFEKRYNFKIEPRTLKRLKEAVAVGMLEKVQPQRLREEIVIILKENDPAKYIRRIKELAGLGFISPRLSLSKKTCSLLSSLKKENAWFKRAYPARRRLDTWLTYFMAMVDPLDLSAVKAVCAKFVFSSGEEKRILNYKKIRREHIKELSRTDIKPERIFALLEPLSYEVILMLKAKYRDMPFRKHVRDFFEIYNGMRILARGADLYRLGVAPGPDYQKIFSAVLKAKLQGAIRTKEEELGLIKKLIRKFNNLHLIK
jgi:tRNA nucleotidyltransferase (CCA-adding enzyme)